ncbi:hypothetical protein NDU88_003235 [Pleurodeles waltl]|uniref:Uncharacterized protein n=1 Tax=Pleurodeles waltl TaxID=8319 RepID=A0AAV7T4N5_PLEWA|nr:hypothetical protein NDU88_003235 [Pleurodeles waltl]
MHLRLEPLTTTTSEIVPHGYIDLPISLAHRQGQSLKEWSCEEPEDRKTRVLASETGRPPGECIGGILLAPVNPAVTSMRPNGLFMILNDECKFLVAVVA